MGLKDERICHWPRKKQGNAMKVDMLGCGVQNKEKIK